MPDVISRLLEQLDRERLSEAEFARRIGESIQTVHNWKKRHNIPSPKLPRAAQTINTTTDWLLTGRDPCPATLQVAEPNGEKYVIDRQALPAEFIQAFARLDNDMRERIIFITIALATKPKRATGTGN